MQSNNPLPDRLSDQPLAPISEQLALLYMDKYMDKPQSDAIKTPVDLANTFASIKRSILHTLKEDDRLNQNA